MYVIPCSGIGKPSASVGREAAYRVVEELRPASADTLCLSLLVLGDEEARDKVKGNPCISIDGCGKDCARKNIELAQGHVAASRRVHDVLKKHRALKPDGVLDIGEPGRKLAELLAGELAKDVDAALEGDDNG